MIVTDDREASSASMTSLSLTVANTGLLISAIFCLLAVIFFGFLVKLYHVRQEFRGLQRQGFPMPPHHPVFGHLPLIASIVGSLPQNAAASYLADQIRRRYPDLDEAFYLDLWPMGPRILMIISPDMIHQYQQDRSLPLFSGSREYIDPLVGEHNLLSMEGSMWKQWRSIFNSSFSAGQIMNYIPGIVEEVVVFRDLLRMRAGGGEILQLEKLVMNLSFDVIGKIVLNHKCNSQRESNDLVSAFRLQVEWSKWFGFNPLEYLNVLRQVITWYSDRRVKSYLSHQLDLQYSNIRVEDIKRTSAVDLALVSHQVSHPPSTGNTAAVTSPMADPAFREIIICQIRILILAGHDTTASSLVYTYYLLSKHPSILSQLQEEHKSVFGPDIAALPTILASTPHILNKLPVTLAVIKETLRLFPPAIVARSGQPGFFLSSSTNTRFPTEKCMVWGSQHGLQRNPRYWPRPEEFLPDRWLVSEGDPLYPTKDAWRPFEKGPKNCLGQELAIAELKVILALTIREFKITDAYTEWDLQKGTSKREREGVNGERAFQFLQGGGHSSAFYPCRVESLVM